MSQVPAQIETERKWLVAKSNDLIQNTRYKLPLLEYKVLLRIFQKIRPDQTKLEPIYFDMREFCLLCGKDPDSGRNFELTRKAVHNLLSRHVWIPKLDENMQPILDKKDQPIMESFAWLVYADIKPGEGEIKVELHRTLEKYLTSLTTLYTLLNAYSVFPMKSKYSARIYELLRSYLNIHKKYFSLEKLYEITTDIYAKWGSFHARVIKPAVEDINKFSEIQVMYTQKKGKGKACIGLEFTIYEKDALGKGLAKKEAQLVLDGYLEK